jgi:hypothetical protein
MSANESQHALFAEEPDGQGPSQRHTVQICSYEGNSLQAGIPQPGSGQISST